LPRTLNMFVNRGRDKPRPCHRDTMLRAGPGDWMEWQAGYVSGALLMPISALRTTVQEWMGRSRCALPPCEGSIRADNLIREVAATFFVSKDAARVRLSQRGYLRKEQSGSPLLA
jgi:Zn-dependent peptidase ImmA (M78 family)